MVFFIGIPTESFAREKDTVTELKNYLTAPQTKRADLSEQAFATVPLTREQAAQARVLLWTDLKSRIDIERAAEMKARELIHGEHKLRFDYRVLGEAPPDGRSLFISMHGGGGAPARVNDQQWENQKNLYSPDEGVYVAPRAPTDTWNLWHQAHIDPLFQRLISSLVVYEDVNPNRVYLMGYSAGGDGVYQLAPRMADRWAAAAMMAGHPNETKPLGLRNLPFTLHMGGEDAAYKRNQVAADWKVKLFELHSGDLDGYTHFVKIHKGKGHWMEREDAVAVPWMAQFTRYPVPAKIVWQQDDVTHDSFYWLSVPAGTAKARSVVRADRSGQTIRLNAEDVSELIVRVDDRMVDLDQSVRVIWGGETVFNGKVSRTIAMLYRTLLEREDPELCFSAEINVTK